MTFTNFLQRIKQHLPLIRDCVILGGVPFFSAYCMYMLFVDRMDLSGYAVVSFALFLFSLVDLTVMHSIFRRERSAGFRYVISSARLAIYTGVPIFLLFYSGILRMYVRHFSGMLCAGYLLVVGLGMGTALLHKRLHVFIHNLAFPALSISIILQHFIAINTKTDHIFSQEDSIITALVSISCILATVFMRDTKRGGSVDVTFLVAGCVLWMVAYSAICAEFLPLLFIIYAAFILRHSFGLWSLAMGGYRLYFYIQSFRETEFHFIIRIPYETNCRSIILTSTISTSLMIREKGVNTLPMAVVSVISWETTQLKHSRTLFAEGSGLLSWIY